MNDDTLTKVLRDLEPDARTLDPARLIAGAKRRRSRGLATTGVTSVAVAGVAVGSVLLVGGPGPLDTPVAGSGTATAPTSAPPAATAKPSRPASTVHPHPVKPPTTGSKLGARPIGTIPAGKRVLIAKDRWFETVGTKWRIIERDDSPTGYNEPFGLRGTVGNDNIGDGTSPGMQSSGTATVSVVTSVFKGNARRVIYTMGGTPYEAKVYRLAAVPGWVLSVAEYPTPADAKPGATTGPRGSSSTPVTAGMNDDAVFAYDPDGKLIAQFPSPRDGGPKTHPLSPR